MKRTIMTLPAALTLMAILFNENSLGFERPEQKEYSVEKIPADLLNGADAVVRKRLVRFEVKSERRAIEKVTFAVTIFRRDERHYGRLALWYDKLRDIEDLDGKLYDVDGNEIRSLDKDDIKDFSDFEEYSLYADSRNRVAEMFYDKYPYTVEYTYELSFDGYIDWPSWYSQTSLDPVEKNRFEVVLPSEETLRFWCNRDSIQPLIVPDGSKHMYVWEADDLPKLSRDVYGDNIEDVAVVVHIAPTTFELEGFQGDMRTWKDLGVWIAGLYNGRNELPDAAVHDVESLVGPQDSDRQKIEKLYRYMQARTRYVSVELGIGGWQPFDAKYVHDRGYGDCKALSNYMVALLRKAGISAYPVCVETGSDPDPLIPNFPRNQFDHVIVCVPQPHDSVWLECTSSITPMGHLGSATENRQALLITSDSGVVVETPKSTSNMNTQTDLVYVKLFSDGSSIAGATISWTGDQQDYVRSELEEASPSDRNDWIIKSINIPNLNLKNYTLEGIETPGPSLTLRVSLTLPNYASVSGNRIFVQPNMMERSTYVPPNVEKRYSPVRFSYPYHDSDSIYFSIPAGYVTEALPTEATLESSFARFSSKTVSLGDTALVFRRDLDVHSYMIPAENYAEYRNFFSAVLKADRAQVVLVRKK